MISDLVTLIEFVTKYGIWGILIISIGIIVELIRVILDEDRSDAWRARISWAKYKLSGESKAEKKYIENDINSRINLARRAMPFGKEYLPKAIKIDWFEGGEGQTANIKNNEIVVRLDPADLQERNIVLLAGALVEQTALVGIRYVLKEALERSMDLNIIKNLLKAIGNKRVLDWYLRNEYQPDIDKSNEIKKWNDKIVEIDESGLFTRMLLVELDDYSRRIVGKLSSQEMFDEVAGLVNFIYEIATRSYSQETPLDYTSRNIKIGVILVGKTSKILSGIERYLMAFAYKMEEQVTSIYVVVWDKEALGSTDSEAYNEFVEMTESLDNEIQKTFRVPKDFGPLKYKFTDANGDRRTGKISHYTPEYVA